MQPDSDKVAVYAYTRLAGELPGNLFYHCLFHTRDMVMPAIRRLAEWEGIAAAECVLLESAAYLHDVGFVLRYWNNEILAAEIAAEILPSLGFGDDHIEVIRGIIMATHMPQQPSTALQAIMCDADLAHLGMTDFIFLNECLRRERAAYGQHFAPVDWYRDSIAFLENHRYFTPTARTHFEPEKERNIGRLYSKMSNCSNREPS
jgi:uncharacterized protein